MSIPTYIVNSSTSIVLIDSSRISTNSYALVYLSTVEFPGTVVTVRDYIGEAGTAKQIVLSTTQGLTFQDGSFSTLINQPFGFMTFASAPPISWQILNSYAFANVSQAAYVRNLTTDVIYTSTLQALSGGFFSTLSVGTSLVVGGSTLMFGDVSMEYAIFVKGGLTVNGSTIFQGPQSIENDLLVKGSVSVNLSSILNGSVYLSSFASFSSFSTRGDANVSGDLFISGRGTLNSFSTLTNASIGGTLTTTSFSTLANAGVGGDLFVSGRGTLNSFSTLTNASIGGTLTTTSFSTLANAGVDGYLSVNGCISTSKSIVALQSILASTLGLGYNNTVVQPGYVLDVSGDIYVAGILSTTSTIVAAGNITSGGKISSLTLDVGTLKVTTITGAGAPAAVTRFDTLPIGSGNTSVQSGYVLDVSGGTYATGTISTTGILVAGGTIFANKLAVATTSVTSSYNTDLSGNLLCRGQINSYLGMTVNTQSTSTDLHGVALYVNGAITATDNITAYSDVRLKTNISTIGNALEKINQLRGVYYTSLSEESTQNIGVIAQEIEQHFPEVVHTEQSEQAIKSVAYGNIVAILIEGIKTLTQRANDLEATVSTLSAAQ